MPAGGHFSAYIMVIAMIDVAEYFASALAEFRASRTYQNGRNKHDDGRHASSLLNIAAHTQWRSHSTKPQEASHAKENIYLPGNTPPGHHHRIYIFIIRF